MLGDIFWAGRNQRKVIEILGGILGLVEPMQCQRVPFSGSEVLRISAQLVLDGWCSNELMTFVKWAA